MLNLHLYFLECIFEYIFKHTAMLLQFMYRATIKRLYRLSRIYFLRVYAKVGSTLITGISEITFV